MTANVSHTHIPDYDTQLSFAKAYADRGFKVIATALSWQQSTDLSNALKKDGVEAEAVALDPLTKRDGVFDQDTFVLWTEKDLRAIEAGKPLVDTLRDLAHASASQVRIAQDSFLDPQDVMRYHRKGPGR